jgi:hypothetical protein
MLSKKKDSGLNDGIAGKYVKRETPPVLRSKYRLPFQSLFTGLCCVGQISD